MSSKKYKLHFVSSIIQTIREVKTFIFPALLVLMANGFQLKITSFESAMEFISVIVIIGIFLHTIVRGITTWLTFTYWIEDEELKIEYGLLFKKKRYIPIERIQNLNYYEGVIHRLFHVVQVSIETAGGATDISDVDLSAITKQAANEIEQLINQSRKLHLQNEQTLPKNDIVFKISNKTLLLLATTSSSIGVVLASVGALFTQLVEVIPFEKISMQFSFLQQTSFIFIILSALLIAWIISVVMTYLSYYNFTLTYFNDLLEISRGLVGKKKITIPVEKIQAIKIIENPLRQLFGFATVVIENGGNSIESVNEKKVVLLPLIKKSEIEPILQNTMNLRISLEHGDFSPKLARPLFYRKYIIISIGLASIFTIYLSYYSLILLLLIPFSIFLGFYQHQNAGFKLVDNQLLVQYRLISKVLYIAKYNKIQALEIKQTIFQKRLQLYTGKIYVMGNSGGVKIKIYNQSKEAMDKVYLFIKRRC